MSGIINAAGSSSPFTHLPTIALGLLFILLNNSFQASPIFDGIFSKNFLYFLISSQGHEDTGVKSLSFNQF
jgi:hypothetical protein